MTGNMLRTHEDSVCCPPVREDKQLETDDDGTRVRSTVTYCRLDTVVVGEYLPSMTHSRSGLQEGRHEYRIRAILPPLLDCLCTHTYIRSRSNQLDYMLPGDQGSLFTYSQYNNICTRMQCSMRMSGTSVLELELVSCAQGGRLNRVWMACPSLRCPDL